MTKPGSARRNCERRTAGGVVPARRKRAKTGAFPRTRPNHARGVPIAVTVAAASFTAPPMPMSSDPRAAAETTASAAGIAEHLSKVTGELERLRTALDTKLAKLEAALENPDTCPSLETLVIDLARVATREADATATRASLEARLVVEDHVAAQRGAESDRAAVAALRADLDAARTALDSERAAS